MTLKELSQLYYLNREIDADRERLSSLRASISSPRTPSYNGMPKSPSCENMLECRISEIAELEASIRTKLAMCIREKLRLERYIAGIPDSYLRQIFYLRFVDGLNWVQVAHRTAGGTPDSVRMACRRYIAKSEKKENHAEA